MTGGEGRAEWKKCKTSMFTSCSPSRYLTSWNRAVSELAIKMNVQPSRSSKLTEVGGGVNFRYDVRNRKDISIPILATEQT